MARAWRETRVIPTYCIGKAEKNPIFLEGRVYQGSSGAVYPYPVVESVADVRTDDPYEAVWIENEYLKVMILPELGGRIQMAYDKIKQRHFIYHNHVIKPALVGLTGPWISGGIEFNWPQHHRPSTFLPVDCTIEEHADGAVTVWVNEMERMTHQKGRAGFTLRPGCAYLEVRGAVYNRTPLAQTFLWWANPAVEVNDDYQTAFPPDVNAVFDHGKRAVASFPVATGTYYKMDYSAGVDISNYRNIKVPTSYMAAGSKYDFEGGYENDTRGGMLHVASHHLAPGKKQWTWGNGDFGRAWDRNLTDALSQKEAREWGLTREGYRPYIELMAGVYTENQPDFSWLMPYEEKQFTQYFMPYRELGIVKQATRDFIFNMEEVRDAGTSEVRVMLLATSKRIVRIVLLGTNGEEYVNKMVTLSPEEVFEQVVDVKEAKLNELEFHILRPEESSVFYLSSSLLSWQAEPDEIRPIPDAAEAPLPPSETKTNDQLYLTGLHLEQYRHATWSALDYYEEALRRDPSDVRCLNQMGLWYLRRGRFDKAETNLRKAVRIWQKRNPNPYDGEAIFYLALALKYQSRLNEAYELFWKSTWNKAWADAGYFEAACISTAQGRYDAALDELNRCLIFNSCNHKARALKAAVLRKKGVEDSKVFALIDESLGLDLFNYGTLFEKYLLTKDGAVLERMKDLMHGNVYNYHELALDYAQAGLWHEAEQVLLNASTPSPLTCYYLGYFSVMQGEMGEAEACFRQAEQTDSYCCFPNRLEDVVVLNVAKSVNPQGALAPYYLGCLYYDKRQYDLAIENWELSARLDHSFPTVWRCLALARFNKQNRPDEALEYMEKAFHLDESDARIFMELDQLYKRLHRPHEERLEFLQQHPALIQQRDDLVLEEITLLNQTGRFEEAMRKLDAHTFHPWEGGEGKVPAQYQICRMEIAKQLIVQGGESLQKAKRLLEECLTYPLHLGEGKLYGAQENDIYYLLGIVSNALGLKDEAIKCWELGTVGPTEPAAAMYYNDAKPDKIFYAGLCYRALGQEDKARSLFHRLTDYGRQHIFEHQTMDYFAVSLPDLLIWDDSLDNKNQIHCRYMLALGYYGLGDEAHTRRYLAEAEALDPNHQGLQGLRSLMQLNTSCELTN
ncbi:MAG: DUF5107 domain-containing protein [Bacteroidaceae bacterium]|nr:DUF5107 domain-containing protein [Bacteroidaceae bacterium]